jgi:hypothetical protein
MTSGIRANWMRSILSCVKESSARHPAMADVAIPSTTASAVIVITDRQQPQRQAQSATSELSIRPAATRSSSAHRVLTILTTATSQNVTPAERPSAPSPPGRLIAATVASRQPVDELQATRTVIGLHQQAQLQPASSQAFGTRRPTTEADGCDSGAAMIKGRAAMRRSRPMTKAESGSIDSRSAMPPSSNYSIVPSMAAAERVGTSRGPTDAVSSDAFSTSESEGSTSWTYHTTSCDPSSSQGLTYQDDLSHRRQTDAVRHSNELRSYAPRTEPRQQTTLAGRQIVSGNDALETSDRNTEIRGRDKTRSKPSRRPPSPPANSSQRVHRQPSAYDEDGSGSNIGASRISTSGSSELSKADVSDMFACF